MNKPQQFCQHSKRLSLIVFFATIFTTAHAQERYGRESSCPGTFDFTWDGFNFEHEGDVRSSSKDNAVRFKMRLNSWPDEGPVRVDIKGPSFEVSNVLLQQDDEKGKEFRVCGRTIRFWVAPMSSSPRRIAAQALEDF